MFHQLTPEAEIDLDDIWWYVASQSANMDIADKFVDSITDRFPFLASFPYAGRIRIEFGKGRRSFPVGEYLIVYSVKGEEVVILRVVHGKRQLEDIFET